MTTNNRYEGQFYRSRNGWILGVCKGLSEYSGIPTFLIRFAMFLAFWFSGLMPIALIYIVAAIIMRPEPVLCPRDESEKDFYERWASDRTGTLTSLKRKFQKLDRRTQRLESIVTAKEYDWDKRFNQQ